MRAITRFIATIGAATFVGSLAALMILMTTDPAPAVWHVAKTGFFLLLAYSAPFVTAGLFLFGLPVDWALRMRGHHHGGVYGIAGALGGAVFAFLIAHRFEDSGWPERAYTFIMIGGVYGLSTAIFFWLIFRRGRTPTA